MLIFVMTYIKIFLQNIAFYSTKSDTRSAIKLYKYLIRQCDKLPKGPKEHYIHMVKQVSFLNSKLSQFEIIFVRVLNSM